MRKKNYKPRIAVDLPGIVYDLWSIKIGLLDIDNDPLNTKSMLQPSNQPFQSASPGFRLFRFYYAYDKDAAHPTS
ncbi:MAG: hypothetical protein KAW12_09065 [Candidatus Aminicenantes bacterium]|nr:hypothetical protein [Candidatus Aminicenantes bacterium]